METPTTLRHGASFSMVDAKPVNMITAVESILSQTKATDEIERLIRHQMSSLLMAHRQRKGLSKVKPKVDKDLIIVSADKDLAIETIELLLQSKYDETENRLRHAQVLQLLKFCLKTYFTFDETIYEHLKSASMGSPIPRLSRAGPTAVGVAVFSTPQTKILSSVYG
ncbi:hypothetical protein SprV_0100291100 [Sparganum proliferum]